jgi:hypothetical protein
MSMTSEYETYEFEGEYEGEGEWETLEYEGEGEYQGEFEGEYEYEGEAFLGNILGSILGGGELPSPLTEQEEQELATELLEVTNEYELEQFLGKLISGAARGIRNFARSGVGRAVGGVLKNVAKTALPVVGGALGSFVAPGVGTVIGRQLGSLASRALEFEGELSPELMEFEVARRVVRIGASAAAQAARAPRGVPPAAVARRAVVRATRMHAPAAAPRAARVTTAGRPASRGAPRPGARRPMPTSTMGYRPRFRRRRPRYDGWGGPGYAPTYGPGYEPAPFPTEPAWAGTERGEWVRRGNRIVLLDV